MFYDRKIKYFDYKKAGERLNSAGFIKLEVRDAVCHVQIQVTGLYMTDTFSKPVYLLAQGNEELLCQIELQNGRGNAILKLPSENLSNGVSYQELQGIRIPLGVGRELYCRIADWDIQEKSIPESMPESIPVKEELSEESDFEEATDLIEESISTEESSEDSSCSAQMLTNKWEQLCAIYPHMTPFQDERNYLRVGLEDFVILHQKYYQLVHNSFLLHGYYNYQHLILTQQERREEVRYYIGVPGNFYEREKQVAVMFGFESFECKEEPASMGVFGYYMIRVEL